MEDTIEYTAFLIFPRGEVSRMSDSLITDLARNDAVYEANLAAGEVTGVAELSITILTYKKKDPWDILNGVLSQEVQFLGMFPSEDIGNEGLITRSTGDAE